MNRNLTTTLCAAGLMLMSLTTGCSGGSNDDDGASSMPSASTGVPDTPLDDAALARLNGVWEQRGYGNVFDFNNNRTTLYSLNDATCLEFTTFEGVGGIAPDELEHARYDLAGNELSLLLPGGAFPLRLTRLETLPARCDEPVENSPQAVFDYLWSTFDEYYAFFELRGVDWAAEYAAQSPRVAEATDDAALFGLLSDLLSPIDDGHVRLKSDEDFFSPAVAGGVDLELRQAFAAQSEESDIEVWVDGVFDQFEQNLVSRLDPGSVNEQGAMNWATAANGTVGYLFIEGMGDFVPGADDDDADIDFTEFEDLQAARQTMDQAMADLASTSRMIVDVRLNGGGADAIALDFASRFVSERQLAFSKTARSRHFESAPVQAWLEPPASGAYLNPVTLIIGADTGSAAEVFAIPMHRQPQVTVIGETTAGALSDVLVKPLPNGWIAGLSNEVYLDSEGASFENRGLSPEIEVPVFRVADILAGEDPALDRALSMP